MPDIRDSIRSAIDRSMKVVQDDTEVVAKAFGPPPQPQSATISPEAIEVFQRAQMALAEVKDSDVQGDFVHTEDPDVAILLSALESAVDPAEAQAKDSVAGFHKYDTTDPNWVLCLVNELVRSKVPFIYPKKPGDFRFKLPDHDLTVAICGDWGTGLWSSSQIANYMKAQNPDITIHLGDVYYSGSENEVKEKFLKRFPRGTYGSYA
ncbi:MAG TPA: hypothetical protein VMU84_09655, partial [Thermoanaerobaculia bacterium]|nr:hypothetical protein [Thermoanaerobaculia bacterium]